MLGFAGNFTWGDRTLQREAFARVVPPAWIVLQFSRRGEHKASADQHRFTNGIEGFLAAPRIYADDVHHVATEDRMALALHGHLLFDDGQNCLEDENAAQRIFDIYRDQGIGGLGRLSGNFALCLLDPTRGMWLMRDAAGTKPLYVSGPNMQRAPHCTFGTSAMDAARLAGGPLRSDAGALRQFLLRGLAPASHQTMISGVRCVPAGHAIRFGTDLGAHETVCHRSPLAGQASSVEREAEAATRLLKLVQQVVGAQSVTSGAACALSGGIDSSSILASLHAAQPTGLRCFTYSNHEHELPAAWDEKSYAEQAAQRFGAQVTWVGLASSEVPRLFASVSNSQDFPFGSPVVMAQAHLFRSAAASGVRCMLSGHGPDSLFGGGSSHLIARARDLLAHGRAVDALRLALAGEAYTGVAAMRMVATVAAQYLPGTVKRFGAASSFEWGRAAWFQARNVGTDVLETHGRTTLAAVIDDQIYSSLIPVSLAIEECNARVCDIDNRSPYLVREVLDFAASLSADLVVAPGGVTKSLMRKAFANQLPSPILNRKQGVGFAVPVLPWLLSLPEWSLKRIEALQRLPFYDGPGPAHVFELLARNDQRAWRTAFAVWRWLSLSEWMETHQIDFD